MSFKKGDLVQVWDFLAEAEKDSEGEGASNHLTLPDHGQFGIVMRRAELGDKRLSFDGRMEKLTPNNAQNCFLVMFAGKPLSNEGAHTDFINKCWLRPATQQMMDEQRSR
tara:strand:- start:63 stop:392 length:330 start_codon:yes stop_codon:yes gene_type:complete